MNLFLQTFINLWKNFDRGELPNYPDPDPPADLGDPLTQNEIDFVKSLKKEMEERFATDICGSEVTGASITNNYYTSFRAAWTNPVSYIGTQITYRVQGTTTWLIPNAIGNATGAFSGPAAFIFTSGFSDSITYEIRIQNACTNGFLSSGVVVSDTATNIAP